TKMAFKLAHVVDLAERALVRQLLRRNVLRRETEVLPIHQDHPGPAACLDHPVTVTRVQRHRFVDEHMLTRRSRRERHLAVEIVRTGDRNGIDETTIQHVPVVLEDMLYLVAPMKLP